MQGERDQPHYTSDPWQDSEALLRAMIENLPGGAAFVVDPDLRYRLAEGEALSVAGLKPEDLVGRTIFEVLPPDLATSYEVRYRKALAGEPFEHEHSAHDRFYISRGTPLRSANGEVYAVLAVSYDITDRRQAEAAAAAELEDTQRLRELSVRLVAEDDIQTLYQEIMATAIALTRADAGSIQILDEATQDLVLLATQGITPAMIEHFYRVNADSNTPCGMALTTGDRTFVDFDVPESEDPDGSMRLHLEAGYFSAQSTPLITRSGKAIGMVSTHWRKHHRPSDRELRFLDLLARQAADLIEQRQAQVALRESEAKYRSLFESIDEGFCLFELIYEETGKAVDYRFLEVNPVFERQTGLKNAAGKLGSEIAPNTESYWLEAYDEVVKTGKPQRIENYNQSTGRWYRAYTSRVGGAGSRQVCIVFDDITERKRAEETQAFLLKLSDSLRPLSDPVAVQETAMQVLGAHMGVHRAFYGEVLDDNDTLVIGPGYSNELSSLTGQIKFSEFDSDLLTAYRAGQTVVINDLYLDVKLSAKAKAAFNAIQVRAAVGVALVKNEKVRAILSIHQSVPRKWTEAEIALLEETAERTWASVERAKAEEALRESEERMQLAIRATRMVTWEWIPSEDRITTSDSFTDLYGLPALTGVEEGFALVLPEDKEAHIAKVRKIAAKGGSYDSEFRIKRRDDGRIVWLEERAEAQLGSDGKVERVIGVTIDITERKRAGDALRESELQRIREQTAREEERQRAESLAELDRAKTLFFSNVSHEFRTPLTLSLAPLQDALSDRTHPLDPVHRERLELVHRNSLRLLKLVNTLLDFSRIEAGRMEAVYEPVDLAMFTTELASVFRSAVERAGLRLIVDCPPLPEPVFVDRQMWEKIVLNLLSNAFKFTFEGEIRVSLRSTDGNQALLQIQDTGTGIVPKHLPHLFERFYQVRGTRARTHEGSGIGLALVHELVRLHGGTIDVSSTVGEGTCFMIALPFGTEHLPSERLQFEGARKPPRILASTAIGAASYVEEVERWLPNGENREQTIENAQEQTAQTTDSSLPTLASARVLLVDDNADMREYLTRILSEHVQVEAVADGATALEVAQERIPDLILSDVMMPGLDGFELLRALRSDSRTREVPIIVLSARTGEDAIIGGLEAGADDYLIKPFCAQELVSRVTAHLQMAQLRGEALQQARSTIRSRDEMISTISHELNTPLVSILGWTRLLRSSPPSPVMLSRALDIIERNATLQGKLVQDLLDISRISAGKLRLNQKPIELQPVIETALATVMQTATDKGINLKRQENVTEPLVVSGDSHRLEQVICNLLTNAIKFTPESGNVTLELSVIHNAHASDISNAEIRVTDTGVGISADFLPHVFERFRQAEGANSAKGLGLGLAIARRLVELHNGTIHAESAGEGLGATFTVRLPLLQGRDDLM